MMAEKKITHVVKLQIQAGKANPAPPVGPALGPTGINIMQFCKDFNEKTDSCFLSGAGAKEKGFRSFVHSWKRWQCG